MRFVVIDNTSIDLRPQYRFDAFSTVHIRDFKIQRLGQQRKRKTIKRLNKQWQLCTCVTLFSTFLCRFCTTTTLKCLIPRFMEPEKNKQRRKFNSLFELGYGLKDSIPGGFAYIWENNWVGIIPIKTERTQIHFLSDVLVAVASLNLKVPIKKFKINRVARWEVS